MRMIMLVGIVTMISHLLQRAKKKKKNKKFAICFYVHSIITNDDRFDIVMFACVSVREKEMGKEKKKDLLLFLVNKLF